MALEDYALVQRVGITGPWDEVVARVEKDGHCVSSVEDIVERRIATDRQACKEGAWTSENFNYLPNGKILIAKRADNPLLTNARTARLAHETHREYYLKDEDSERLRDTAQDDLGREPEERRVFIMSNNDSHVVTLLGLPHDDLFRFLVRDKIRAYRDLLKKQGARGMRIQVLDKAYVAKQKAPFGKALWFDDILSGFVGNTDLTHYQPGRVYGSKTA